MDNLESLFAELSNEQLNLNIGNYQTINNELLRLNNILSILNEIEKEIDGELGFEKMKNAAMGALPFVGTVASFLIPGGFLVEAVIAGSAGLLASKLGNKEGEITLSDLQERIYVLINWINYIQQIAEYLLNNSLILNEINNYLTWENIDNKLQRLDQSIQINLSFNNADLLKRQLNQISNTQDDLIQLQYRVNNAYDKLRNGEDIGQIIIGLSNYYGNCSFSLEDIDDDHGLIISSQGEFLSLADIINNCEYFQQKIGDLILNGNHLKSQAEEALQRLKNNQDKKNQESKKSSQHHQISAVTNTYQSPKIPLLRYLKYSLVVGIVSTILLFIGILIGKDKLPQIQQISVNNNSLNNNQEEKAKNDFEAAQKLGMEASIIVQNPPHPQELWEKSHIKWQEAISLLQKIPEGTSISEKAKKQISNYQANSKAISMRILNEKKATENFELSQKIAIEASILVQNPPHSPKVWKQAQLKWQQAINLLESIPEGTFIYKKAQEKLSSYKTNYTAVSTQVKN